MSDLDSPTAIALATIKHHGDQAPVYAAEQIGRLKMERDEAGAQSVVTCWPGGLARQVGDSGGDQPGGGVHPGVIRFGVTLLKTSAR